MSIAMYRHRQAMTRRQHLQMTRKSQADPEWTVQYEKEMEMEKKKELELELTERLQGSKPISEW